MNILLVAATEAEIKPFLQRMAGDVRLQARIDVCITGVGMLAATYAIAKALKQHKYDFVLQAGIAGSFDRQVALGDMLFVTSEQLGDMGAEDHDKHLDIFGMGLQDADKVPFTNQRLSTPLSKVHDHIQLPEVAGITVNMVSGNANTIARLTARYGATTESMEGAALHYVCLMEQVPFAQVRCISNYIEPRNRNAWDIPLAVENLNEWLARFVAGLGIATSS
jgi:futalosine hydrolase